MIKYFIIIGGGPAGHAAALAAAESGAGPVLLVEKDALGGTCTNRGCIPTKFLLSRSGHGEGAPAGQWARLLAHKDALVRGLSRSIGTGLETAGVKVVRGIGRLVGPDAVSVEMADGTRETYAAGRILIAAGSEPAGLRGVELDGRTAITSTEALDLKALPESVVIVGSGAVGSEFAFIFARLGVSVTIVEALGQLFPQEDPEVDALFRKTYARMGVEFLVGDPVEGAERVGEGMRIALRSGSVLDASVVLVGVGRRLCTAGLGCEAAGVRLGGRGEILVDENLMTSAVGVYAAGDVTGKMLLAHVASYQGEYAARRALGLQFGAVPYGSIPWAIFTVPEVASVGMNSAAATRAGVACAVGTASFMDNVKSRIDRETEGFIKVVAEAASGKIIGGTVVGAHASDLVHMLAVAINRGMTVEETRAVVLGHPTVSETFAHAFRNLEKNIKTIHY